jgi:hypothetical protein
MGDTGPNNDTWGYAFRGQRIITAALTQLVQQHGMGMYPAGAPGKPRLLFGGCSAGARGAMVNLDGIGTTLQGLGVDMQARPARAEGCVQQAHRKTRASLHVLTVSVCSVLC